ncbi:MAG: tripartite tricarboxylate transporter substrate binding protein [Betaproteobacteria bacterium]
MKKLFCLLAFVPCLVPLVHAQNYPARPLRLIVPTAPGGGTDFTGRLVAAKLSETMGQQVVVENRGGGGGSVGADNAAKATADGYTLLLGSIATHAVNPALYKKLPYDHLKDFASVSLIGTVPNALVVHPSLPVKSMQEFITYAKANPGKINYGSSGVGSPPHLSMELLRSMTGINLVHVPYKGAGPALADLLGGQVQAMCTSLAGLINFVKSGRVRALGVTTAKRNPQLPDVPTIVESGVPGYEVTIWYAVFAPVATPKAIVDKLNAEMVKALNSSEMKERMALQGMDPAPSTPAELTAFVKVETAKWAKAAKDSGATAE